ncbi:MAG: hypothetical protein O4750_12525 [Trichodesmium sp. St18_bin3_1_1]|nr:hypothetical protein [Trichodesmium sp. St5_bin8]MDE5092553.1 hypothetical protein [Trichodesmium sp. St18_bin3_1_1]
MRDGYITTYNIDLKSDGIIVSLRERVSEDITTRNPTVILGNVNVIIDDDVGDSLSAGEQTVIGGDVDVTITNFIHNDRVNQNLDTTLVIPNKNVLNNQLLNQEISLNNNNNNIEDNSTISLSGKTNILSNLIRSKRSKLISSYTPSKTYKT